MDLAAQILNLSRERLLEAALALQDQLGIDEAAAATDLIAPWRDAPLSHIAEIEDVVRLFLLCAAADPATAPMVEEIVGSVGRKAFIFGGLEMVAAAAVALAGLQLILSKGKTAESVSIEITEDGGKKSVKINKEVKYGLAAGTPTLIQKLLGAFGGK
jgi:hypothetical protein